MPHIAFEKLVFRSPGQFGFEETFHDFFGGSHGFVVSRKVSEVIAFVFLGKMVVVVDEDAITVGKSLG